MSRDISKIILKSFLESLTTEEHHQLQFWLSNPNNRNIYNSFSNIKRLENDCRIISDRKAQKKDILQHLLRLERKRKRFKIILNLLRYAAVLLVPIAILAYVMNFRINNTYISSQKTKIEENVTQPTLSLSDGKIIPLIKITDTVITTKNIIISNHEGIIQYNIRRPEIVPPMNTIIVPKGATYKVLLSDGTKIKLNAMSEITFPEQFTGNSREIFLKGQAYFEVKENKKNPFVINSKNLKLKVLGTTFGFTSYDNEHIFTTLVEGKVEIKVLGKKSILLKPNQRFQYNQKNESLKIKKVDVEQYLGWIKERFIYNNQRLEDVMEDISRWYNVSIVYKTFEVKNMIVGLSCNRYKTIDPIISALNANSDIKVIKKNNTIIIDKE